MRRLFSLPALLVAFIAAFTGMSAGQSGTGTATTTVTANPSTITVGGSEGLTATVQPNTVTITPGQAFTKPTGTITFLDGTTPLNAAPAALLPDAFSSATFQQTFGTLNPSVAKANSIFTPDELTGDLNGDGIPDLLVYTYESPSGTFYAQAFTSSGKEGYSAGALQTFSFPSSGVTYPSASNSPFLIDLNGDGKLDLMFGIMVAYGNGDGTFAAPVPITFLSSGYVTAYPADLNGDGKKDLLAVNATTSLCCGNYQIVITSFINGGGGSFSPAGSVLIFTGGMADLYVYPPAFVDLNGDGKLDLMFQWNAVDAGSPTVSVLLNNGDGSFGSPTQLSIPNPPFSIAEPSLQYEIGSGDFNGDGKQDVVLVLGGSAGNSAAITLPGNGDGTFQSPLFLNLPSGPTNFVVQDVNLDGKLDLVFGTGALALGNGDGTFSVAAPLFPLPSAGPPYPLVQMDLGGNPVPSLVFLQFSGTPAPAAVFTPQTSSSATLSLATLAAGTHSITARYSGDANYAADTSAAVTVTVNQAVSATAATSSVNPSFAGQSVTLTANVTSNGPTPTGNVTFTSGSTTLATVTLSGGSATYTTTSFTTVGTLAITASYSGDANTQASSASLSQVIDAAFTMEPGGNGSTTLTVQPGQTVSAPINVTGATGFSGQVTFTCSGLPANASCSFSPATITLSGTAVVPTSIAVNTAASATTAGLTLTYGLGLASLLLLWPIRRRRAGRLWAMTIFVVALTAMGLTGCNGSASKTPPETAPGTYSFTVTATSGSVETQSSYTLVVQ